MKRPDGEYVTAPDDLRLLPQAAEGIRLLNESGFAVIVVTNQRGIALGRMTEADLALVHRRLVDELALAGARVDAIYHCPHGEAECDCRKPKAGLLLRAWREHPDVDPPGSVMIGDSIVDAEVGTQLGLRTILVGPADGRGPAAGVEHVPSLWHAARRLADERATAAAES